MAVSPTTARRGLSVLIFAGIVCATFAAGASADGDPASDVLYGQNYYVPDRQRSTDRVSDLRKAISEAYAKRYRVKVVVIATRADLGSVPLFFNKPDAYARFLGIEIASYYVGPLLIVMPSGFGLYDGARSMEIGRHALKKVDFVGGSPDELVATAAGAVRALTRAHALEWHDVLPPLVFPFTSVGRRGQDAQLRYSPHDDSGYARVTFSIRTLEGVQIGLVRTKLEHINLHGLPTVAWRVPTDAPSELRFCVVATDAVGHRSRETCGLLHIS